eukprot:scaffold3912_cov20-Tisochrysis_lutea.AAC.2
MATRRPPGVAPLGPLSSALHSTNPYAFPFACPWMFVHNHPRMFVHNHRNDGCKAATWGAPA